MTMMMTKTMTMTSTMTMTMTMTMTVTVTVTTTNQKLQLATVNQSHTRRDLLELLAAFYGALSRRKSLVKLKMYVRDNYSTIALWPFKPVETKKRKSRRNQHSQSLPRS
jgi:hypothetical protein